MRTSRTARRAAASSSSVPDVVVTNGALEARDEDKHVAVKVASFDAELRPGTKLAVRLRGVHGELALGDDGQGPSFGADEIDVQTALAGLRPDGRAGAARDGGPRVAAAVAVADRHHGRDRAAARGRARARPTA